MVRAIGIEITGKKDVEDLQKNLNNAASLLNGIENKIMSFKKGKNIPLFTVKLRLDTKDAERQLTSLATKFANDLKNATTKGLEMPAYWVKGNKKVSSVSIDKQLIEAMESANKRIRKSQTKLMDNFEKLGTNASEKFTKGLKFKGKVGEKLTKQLDLEIASARQLMQAKKLKIPIKADVDYQFATKNGYIDTSASAIRKAQKQLLSNAEFTKSSSALKYFTKQLDTTSKRTTSSIGNIIKWLNDFAELSAWDTIFEKSSKLAKMSLDTSLKPATKIGSYLGSQVQSQMSQTASMLQRTYANAFNKIQNYGERAFGGIVEEARELGDAVEAYGVQMRSAGMSAEEVAKYQKEITEYGVQTAYDGKDLITNLGAFQALNVEDAVGLTKAVAGFAAGHKSPTSAYEGIAKQLRDILQTGSLSWQDVKVIQQWQSPLATAKLNEYLKANNMLGGQESLKAAIKEKTISAEDYIKAVTAVGNSDELQAMTNTIFTPSAAMNNLRENIANILIGVEGSDGAFKGLYNTIVKVIKGTADWVSNNEGLIRQFGAWTDSVIETSGKFLNDMKEGYGDVAKTGLAGLIKDFKGNFNAQRVAVGAENTTSALANFSNPYRGAVLGSFSSEFLSLFGTITASFIELGGALLDVDAIYLITDKLTVLNNVIDGIAHSESLGAVIGVFRNVYGLLNTLATNEALTGAVDSVLTTLSVVVIGFIQQLTKVAQTPEFASFVTFLGEQLNLLITNLGSTFTELTLGLGGALNSDVGRDFLVSVREFLEELGYLIVTIVKSQGEDGTVKSGFESILGFFKTIADILKALIEFFNRHPKMTGWIAKFVAFGFIGVKIIKIFSGIFGFLKPLWDLLKGGGSVVNSLFTFFKNWKAMGFIGAIKALFSKGGGKVAETAIEVAETAGETVATASGASKKGGLLSKVWTGTKNVFSKGWGGIKTAGSFLLGGAKNIIGGIPGLAGKAWGGLKNLGTTVANSKIGGVLGKSLPVLKNVAPSALVLNLANGLVQNTDLLPQGGKSAFGALTSIGNGAAMGATIGSMIPIVGTGVGAIAGAVIAGAGELINGVTNELETYSIEEAQAKISEMSGVLSKVRSLPLTALKDSFDSAYAESGDISTAVTQALEENGVYNDELKNKIVEKVSQGQSFNQALMESTQELQHELNNLQQRTEDAVKQGKDSVTVGDSFWQGIFDGWGKVAEFFGGILSGIGSFVNDVKNFFKGAYDNAKQWLADLWTKITGGDSENPTTKKTDSKNKFNGGVVYRANGGGINWTPRGTDTVPAMLTEGEYVLRKKAVDSVGTAFLNRLNRQGTKALSSQTTNNRTIVNNYYNTNNARVSQQINNQSQFLNGMAGLDRMMRFV